MRAGRSWSHKRRSQNRWDLNINRVSAACYSCCCCCCGWFPVESCRLRHNKHVSAAQCQSSRLMCTRQTRHHATAPCFSEVAHDSALYCTPHCILYCVVLPQSPRTSPKRYSCSPHAPTAFITLALCTTRTGMPAARARSWRSVWVVALQVCIHIQYIQDVRHVGRKCG